ncbi:MAG: NAD(P)/FAD-dependent oxidoreductase [Chloroflexi bacterium]|nr:NAD(P)/FAD-dependent oxidoreductase [Chloroflexota bacterium]
MRTPVWDAIIVGARIAGTATAIGLARRGLRVLMLDRAAFPSDTLCTHYFQRDVAIQFARLGVLDEIEATGPPPLRKVRTVAPDDGIEFTETMQQLGGVDAGYCVRRSVLDDILVRAARAAGVEVREHTTITGLIWEDGQVGGVEAEETNKRGYKEPARVVIGADGRHSRVARWTGAHTYERAPALAPHYYAYFRGVAGDGNAVEWFHTARRRYALLPTNDGLSCVSVALPQHEIGPYRDAIERSLLADLRLVPELADRLAGAERVGPVRGTGDIDSHLRVPAGPGWLLVGDAGAHIHPVKTRGIGLALHDADVLAEALSASLAGERAPDEALADYHRLRDVERERLYQEALAAAWMIGRPLPSEVLEAWAALAQQPDAATRWVNGRVRDDQELQRIIERSDAPQVQS